MEAGVLWLSWVGVAMGQQVEVRGVGPVSLDDALATCVEGQPRGTLEELTPQRGPVFQDVVRSLLEQPLEARAEFLGGERWPMIAADAEYLPQVAMSSPYVAAACLAVGQHRVDVGTELAAACADSKKACKDAFSDDEWLILKAAWKTDDLWATLRGYDDALTTWNDAEPMLRRACETPAIASAAGRFVDDAELTAARLGCLQLLALVERSLPESLPLACDGDWASTAADLEGIRVPGVDLGVAAAYPDPQFLVDRVAAMDPAPCGPEAGEVWRSEVLNQWRTAQAARACVDPELPMTDRRHLCPDLNERLRNECREDDALACHTLARITLVGLGVPMDERGAVGLLGRGCELGDASSCEELASFTPMVTAWLEEEREREGGLADAMVTLTQFTVGMGEAWTREHAELLFDAAIDAKDFDLGRQVLETFAGHLDEGWVGKAERKLPKG